MYMDTILRKTKAHFLLSSVLALTANAMSKWNGSPKLHREKITGPRAHETIRVNTMYF